MVLSLADISLRSIMDGVENGTIEDLHRFLLPKFRQRLLHVVLARRKIDNPIWIRELSSAEYLRGLTSFEIQNENGKRTYVEYLVFDTQRGRKNDDEYLNKVADSMGSILEGGETIGAKVKKLNLNVYAVKGSRGERVLNRGGLVRLIGRCSNLKSLDLRWKYVDDKGPAEHSSKFGPILNRVESLKECWPILENLDELSVTGQSGECILVADHPIIHLKKLSSLRLIKCQVDGWKVLLKSIQGTLTHLHITSLYIESSRGTPFASWCSHLPIPLPLLISLKIDGDGDEIDDDEIDGNGDFRCTRSFVENLLQSTKLESVYLDLSYYAFPPIIVEDEEYLKAFNRIDTRVEVKIRISNDSANDSEIIDGDSYFKMVSIFKEKITHLDLDVRRWNRRTTIALENVVDVCCNLTSFKFWSPSVDGLIWQDRKSANSALARLFIDRERAAEFRELELNDDIDFEVLTSALENCTNLDSLDIWCNEHFGDEHLIRWIDSSGAKPSKLYIEGCNVSDEGLIPILVSSGDRLKMVNISEDKITDRTWRILIDHCPNIETVWGMPEHLRELAESKCLNIELKEL